ncbi:MAG: PEGA domain-containing protein, partial [Candidatus Eremiobacteraeota bacterium]|nr:PEGA domain-containing protein [Candidatus Eremiobacteraeota bacterium]
PKAPAAEVKPPVAEAKPVLTPEPKAPAIEPKAPAIEPKAPAAEVKPEVKTVLRSESTSQGYQHVVAAIVIVVIIVACLISLSTQKVNMPIPSLPIAPGTLYLDTDPTGASVTCTEDQSISGITPLRVAEVKKGTYHVRLSMKDCLDAEETLEVLPGKETTCMFSLKKTGTLNVQSFPKGASVSVDGMDTGKVTPVLLKDVHEGAHKITLKFGEKGPARDFPAQVEWGRRTEFYGLQDEKKSAVAVECDGTAKVFINGVALGKASEGPYLVNPGSHKITVAKEFYMPWKQEVKVTPGEVAFLAVKPVAQGVLLLEGDYDTAFYVNDRFQGYERQRVLCDPDTPVTVKAVLYDGRVWIREFTLKSGEKKEERVNPDEAVRPETGGLQGDVTETLPPAEQAFSDFSIAERFPEKDFALLKQLYEDIDNEGDQEMVLAFRHIRGTGRDPVELYVVKKAGSDYKVVPLREPAKNEVGYGELKEFSVTKKDDLGYREILYATSDGKSSLAGSFVINRSALDNPLWMKR